MKKYEFRKNIWILEDQVEYFLVNSFVLFSKTGNIVIDTFDTPEKAEQIRALIKEEGRDSFETTVINTHYHYDHAWGNSVFFPCTILGHAMTKQKMIEDEMLLAEFQKKDPAYQTVQIVPPTVTFEESYVLDKGDMVLTLRHMPSHTEDSTLIWLKEAGQEDLLFTGDILEDPFPMLESDLEISWFLKTLREMMDMKAKVYLTSHSGVTSRELLIRNKAYLECLARYMEKVRKEGKGVSCQKAEEMMEMMLSEYEAANGIKRELTREEKNVHIKNVKKALSAAEKAAQK